MKTFRTPSVKSEPALSTVTAPVDDGVYWYQTVRVDAPHDPDSGHGAVALVMSTASLNGRDGTLVA
ncbi:MAG: hypothetical protein MUE82_11110 [Chloroflexi bacterium]|nr:hypothetical protein [Chloroflexota bacterium]